ncbi:MAG: hypothetical protein LBR44_11260 [Clostridiales Family XIII bacterium]|nr:hypothetical protein [Clostridiales Family XIII bacterium]
MNKIWTASLVALLCLLSACSGASSSFVSGLVDGDNWGDLEGKAVAYMDENYGGPFAISDQSEHYTAGLQGGTSRYVFVRDADHPYNDFEVLSPGFDDGAGETLLTTYPYFLFGNEAGQEWERILSEAVPEMGYLPMKWDWAGSEEEGEFGTTWEAPVGGLTKDSTVQDFLLEAPAYGILVVPADATATQDRQALYASVESLWGQFETIDARYDLSLVVLFVGKGDFDELAAQGNPAEVLIKSIYPNGMDIFQGNPVYAFDLCDEDKRILAAIGYEREDGSLQVENMRWEGIEKKDFAA